MGQTSPEQFGLWVACAITFVISVVSFITAYRVLTKNFVTNDQLKVTILEVEQRIEKAIENTRHALRNELQGHLLQMAEKMDKLNDHYSVNRASLARIEGALHIPVIKENQNT